MGYSVPGAQYILFSTIVGTTAAAVLNGPVYYGAESAHNGRVLIQNPHPTASIYLGLAGETPVASATTPVGFLLPPGGGYVIFDLGECPVNPIYAVASAAGTPITIYGIGA